MKIKQRFAKWLLKDDSEAREDNSIAMHAAIAGNMRSSKYNTQSQPTVCCDEDSLQSSNIVLRVYPGLGGVAIESVKYDRQTGDNKVTLHVIPDNVEISDALARIITLESIRGC